MTIGLRTFDFVSYLPTFYPSFYLLINVSCVFLFITMCPNSRHVFVKKFFGQFHLSINPLKKRKTQLIINNR
jgi:hypothetical protein